MNNSKQKFIDNLLDNSIEKYDFDTALGEWCDTVICKETSKDIYEYSCLCETKCKRAFIIRNKETKQLLDVGRTCYYRYFRGKEPTLDDDDYAPIDEKDYDKNESRTHEEHIDWNDITNANVRFVVMKFEDMLKRYKNKPQKLRVLKSLIKDWLDDYEAFLPIYKEVCFFVEPYCLVCYDTLEYNEKRYKKCKMCRLIENKGKFKYINA